MEWDRTRHWIKKAACRGMDPNKFFPVLGTKQTKKEKERQKEAKRICASCEVRKDCLVYALNNQIVHGTWGGMSERERGRRGGKDTVRVA